MAELIDGKALAAEIRQAAALRVKSLNERGKTVGLAVIIVGNDPASRVYVNNKKKACAEVGIESFEYALSEDTTQDELLALIEKLNHDDRVDGILCQLPLPKHLNADAVIDSISPDKDVDGFHAVNVGRLSLNKQGMRPCTPAGVMRMLQSKGIEVEGKHCVVIGRSNIVGKPAAVMLINAGATVTVCNSKTKNLSEITRQADILIAAVGRPGFVTADMVKDGAVVIDVGINRDENGKLCGDVDFDTVKEKASYITPVPGGVGPMTIAELIENTVLSAELKA
ncbi:MAG: bifunctional methylenetetrahydrofolate dehydrogenase/methenyltetrahydrofolate cyclohydrolase FolD [Clostridiales bacterium]|jgi:methylenetetrahydrofolate dehydrogenase (NADP+)/methenyltetrahydrofolate cyclohydrolase|nr:bifunctional methylenetetrahydrofolate dehydrogenase/methenyltetrahydrofolate cyclohydrolase FolD [Clostridiales bacterium]HOA34305.1 bifunctional methylenetetrahydrofolate dehydrogenase/methenyltetrahydrofolate cyclohydrolase FolD [Clostridiales bacterium]HOL78981.1 bifunctional methylenetetrahydrofolate dehydrogenase/methenyltetrahydrofolate cyclohydrolase FolD [Clostridiales bacterium]HPU67360.1 bifunctional methylenetetrahydrofolate dehydrogenase/methenyltetrahydrofolate cyclohydrolase Fo